LASKGGKTLIPNMKFYVISIVAIFAALGIGIYIGFAFDTQDFVVEQREDIIQNLEERFDFLKGENQELKLEIEELELENEDCKTYMLSTYEEMIKGRLLGKSVAIIETKDDYMYSGIGQVLESAGAKVANVVTINDSIMDKEIMERIYEGMNLPVGDINLVSKTTEEIVTGIINGESSAFIKKLEEEHIINIVGMINEPIDYIVIAGGSVSEDRERINLIDKTIVQIGRDKEKNIIGIEKTKIGFSYMESYKEFKISTVDNVDTIIGKVSLILAMEGRPGHYGTKPTAEELMPNLKLSLAEYTEER
jgi:hypothetical protein